MVTTAVHEQLKSQKKEAMKNYRHEMNQKKTRNTGRKSNQYYVKKICAFKSEIQEGPFYACVVCNRCMYKKSIICFSYNGYKS